MTSSNPASLSAGGNLYRYCGNNSVGRTDPGGTQDKPLNPAGEVSWVAPEEVYLKNGQRVNDATAIENFIGAGAGAAVAGLAGYLITKFW